MGNTFSTVDEESIERELLIEKHTAFVHKIVKSTIKVMRLPQRSYNDYVSAGYLGLVEAAERFDPTNGVSFRGFAYLRVRGAIIDSIREENNISGYLYRRLKTIAAMEEDESQLMANDCPSSSLAHLFAFTAKALNSSLMRDVSSEEADEEACVDPEQLSLRRERSTVIKALIKKLPERERYILESHYFLDRSFAEISSIRPELSRSWISRLHSRALTKLHTMMIKYDNGQS